jgi:DNA-binding MarR family transcriptional regulator
VSIPPRSVGGSTRAIHGTGRHLDDAELFAWTRFLDASRLIERVLARHLVDEHNMLHSEYEVLVRLDGDGGTMRLRTLADQVVSSKSKLTHTLNRLSDRGWIERRPTPDDRRGLEAVLTDIGIQVLATAAVGHAELIRTHLLERWSVEETLVIGQAMERVSRDMR